MEISATDSEDAMTANKNQSDANPHAVDKNLLRRQMARAEYEGIREKMPKTS